MRNRADYAPAMLLAYVDESSTRKHYWMGALLCPEDCLIPLARALDEVVEEAADHYRGLSGRAELHGYSVMHGEDDWQSLKPLTRARIGVYAKALEAVGETDARIIIRGVHLPGLRERYTSPYHPHDVTLSHLLERVDECAEEMDERVLVIADQVDRADTHRQRLWTFQRYSTSGYRSRQLTRIVDTMHFAPSEASRLLQAVDLVVYLYQRRRSDSGRDERAQRANRHLWERVRHRVWHERCWYP